MESWSSNKSPQIPIVIDTKTKEPISVFGVNYLYAQDELAYIRFHNLKERRFKCYRCNNVVILASRFDENSPHGHYYHFKHPAGVECEWKYDSPSKAEIYQGVQEGLRHYELKHLIANTVKQLEGWEVISVDKKFVFSPETNERTKPDLLVNFNGKEIAIEIQLRGESPQRILKRHQIHKDRDAYILWVTSESKSVANDDIDEAVSVRQVHKDIAYSNRGNRYLFTKELAAESIREGEFIITVVYEYPEIVGKQIVTSWQSIKVKVSELTFEAGNIFFVDSIKAINILRGKLRSAGLLSAKKILSDKHPHSFEDFLLLTKAAWPTFDKEDDTFKLKEMYDENFNARQLQLKESIVRYFQSPSWREKGDERWWKNMAGKVGNYNFGINTDSDVRVIEKLLLILGIPLSEHLCVAHKSHVRACHNFFDAKSFIPYLHLCKDAVVESVYGLEIVMHPTIKSRVQDEFPNVVQADDLDTFFKWFISTPKVHPLTVDANK